VHCLAPPQPLALVRQGDIAVDGVRVTLATPEPTPAPTGPVDLLVSVGVMQVP